MTEEFTDNALLGSYSVMLSDYLDAQDWLTPADTPLVFHLRKLCAHLDTEGLGNAAMSTAYLKAFAVLEGRRPKDPAAGPHPDQLSIYDELE